MMTHLRDRAHTVRGSFDAGAIAEAGRRRARRRRAALGGTLAAVSLVVAGGGVWGLTAWAGQQPPQHVADDPSPDPTELVVPMIAPIEVTVDTSGWPTYVSPQYPVTFRYPPDWTVGDLGGGDQPLDGCHTLGCVVFVSPPGSSDAASIELIRNGFADPYAPTPPADVEVLGSLPGLTAWDERGQGPAQVVVVKNEDEWGVDYSLMVSGSRAMALDGNPLPNRTETLFTFSTNVGNISGDTGEEHAPTLIAILASIAPNPAFDPTRPLDNGAGESVVNVFDQMSTPTVGTVTPDQTWKTYTSKVGNVTVRYPGSWKVDETLGDYGITWIVAPSGYTVDLLTNESGPVWCDKDHGLSEVLGSVAETKVTAAGSTGPAEIRWANGGELPVWVGLSRPAQSGCYDTDLSFGGTASVYLGSADNWDNPTAKELDEAIAIIASARRVS